MESIQEKMRALANLNRRSEVLMEEIIDEARQELQRWKERRREIEENIKTVEELKEQNIKEEILDRIVSGAVQSCVRYMHIRRSPSPHRPYHIPSTDNRRVRLVRRQLRF